MEKKLKRVLTSFKGRAEGASSSGGRNRTGASIHGVNPGDGTPEGTLLQAIHNFCETGGPGNPNPGEEYLYLPTIVDIAESSPTAAALAATAIRKSLDLKNSSRPYVQYNSIMLMRILAQNPGYTFTRNLADSKFASAVKDLLRQGRDPSVWQILCETLEHFTTNPECIADKGLGVLREVWLKEKATQKKPGSPPFHTGPTNAPPMPVPVPALPPRNALPSALELVGRISEAATSATLLQQVLQSTPQAEIPSNELIIEFADRCKLAARSMQAYISADNPPPDSDTLTTLIETNDALAMALERHRKAVAAALQARETTGSEEARLMNVGDPHAPAMHETGTQDDMSPVSPVTPTRHHSNASNNVFRF